MQRIVKTIALAHNRTPRFHRAMMGSLTVFTLAVIISRLFISHPEHVPSIKNAKLDATQLQFLLPEDSQSIHEKLSIFDDNVLQAPFEQKNIHEQSTYEYVVVPGDTLSSILNQYGVVMSDIALLSIHCRDLSNLKVGQKLSWTINATGYLQQLRWAVSRYKTVTYERISDRFQESQRWRQGEWRNIVLGGHISADFVSSASAVGLSRAEINSVMQVLQWQLDFQKLRKGDQFSAFISREYCGGKKKQSKLLAVHVYTAGKDYYAIHADDGKFYDREGFGLTRSFMRLPTIKHFRISSNFNPRRVNPVTGRIAPHKGVDLAMPIGTPVVAVSDGEVLLAKHSGAAGYYVTIRHNRHYSTCYMHLKKLLVKPGQKVKLGENIALSGNSGGSTGPHLHFELWVNQRAVNPLMAKLPYAKNLSGKERRAYLEKVQQMMNKLKTDE